MFCENCGTQIPEGSRFCAGCGKPVAAQSAPAPVQEQFQAPVQEQFQAPVQEQFQAPVQPQYQAPVQPQYQAPAQPQYQAPVQPQYQAPVQPQYQAPAQPQYQAPVQPQYQAPVQPQYSYQQPQQPAFEVSRPANGKYSKTKKKGGKVGLIVAAAVLVALVACVVLFWNSISGFALRNFGDPTEYMLYVEKNNADTAIETVGGVYGQYLELQAKESGSASIAVRPGESVIALLETALSQEGVDLDLDWLKEVNLNTEVYLDDELKEVDLGVGINGKGVATMKVIMDTDSGMAYVAVPELNDTWISGSVEDVAVSLAANEMVRQFVFALPTEDNLEYLLNKYTDLVFENLGEAEKRTETVTVEGVEQKLVVLRVELTQLELVDILEAVLEEAAKDKDILDMLDDLSAVLETMGEYTDLRSEYAYAIEEALMSLNALRTESTDEVALILDTYVDDSHRIVGRQLDVVAANEKMGYLIAVKGTNFGFEFSAAGTEASGKGSISSKGAEGSFSVFVEGMKALTVEVKDVKLEGESLSGTLIFTPDSILLEEAGVDSSVTSMLGGNLSLRLTLEEKSADLSLMAGNGELLGMEITMTDSELKNINIPDSISVEDNAAMEQWVTELDLNGVIGNLEDAGVPAELIEILNSLAEMLAYM